MTFHLHLKGRVQGVGFRPNVFLLATGQDIKGYVSNEPDGLHIMFNAASEKTARIFAEKIIANRPSKAIIQSWVLSRNASAQFVQFSIRGNLSKGKAELLIAPDFATCLSCQKEFHDPGNRRFQYPFITCTECGPRYTIIEQLPYDRHLTSMRKFIQCSECLREYEDINDRRYFSQTNSCPVCGIQLSFDGKANYNTIHEPNLILLQVIEAFRKGKIVAVKGIGGFLLLCDSADQTVIKLLRERKHRPKKPFAVLFPNLEMVEKYVQVTPSIIKELLSESSAIVLVESKKEIIEQLDKVAIAPFLNSLGVMLPYAPILEWIISAYKKPLISTSGNLSGSCIVFQSEKKEQLYEYADFILDYNRDIVIPQDDSVVKFAKFSGRKIIIRRSRGFAPALMHPSKLETDSTIFAAGAQVKSALAIQYNNQIYLSQFLGNLESYDSQQNYLYTFNHFLKLLKAQPEVILCDLHPDYFSTQMAKDHSLTWQLPLSKIQHHEAHFAAILGEHGLFDSTEKILGVIWDGAGLGTDGNVWGGEFFIYEKRQIRRAHNLQSFPNISGDKIAREPRLSALAISHKIPEAIELLQKNFSKPEWTYFNKAVNHFAILNTSAGRYFDGVSALLSLSSLNSYEGEAGLLLEEHAYGYFKASRSKILESYFEKEINAPVILMEDVVRNIISDIKSGIKTSEIAAKFHATLITIIEKVAEKHAVKKICFSGGVFQNALLLDLIELRFQKTHHLYFHELMPPNDECIAFGQLMHYQFMRSRE